MLDDVHRLTVRTDGVADVQYKGETYPCFKHWFCPEGVCNSPTICDHAARIERLAAYEDTKLYPHEVEKLKEKAKRQAAQIRQLKEQIRALEGKQAEE